MKRYILIVEDDLEQLERYLKLLKELDVEFDAVRDIDQAKLVLDNRAVDILITDIHLNDSPHRNSFEGFELLKFARKNHPECICLVMSNDPKASTYDKAFALGALYFIKKPILNADEITMAIRLGKERKTFAKLTNRKNTLVLPDDIKDKCDLGIYLESKIKESAGYLIDAPELPGIIYGESGSGKEEVVKYIHQKRCQKEGLIPFVAVNCANFTSSTMAAQVFGHVKGSFTGADKTTIGYVGEADGGILFLDEVHALSIDCQRRLLRVLNDGSYQRFGDTKTLFSAFQVIVATTKDIDILVNEGKFLPDLRSRLTGITIKINPLRERLKDIDIFVPLMLSKLGAKIDPGELEKLIERCKEYYWQENLRLLFNVLKSSVTICRCQKRSMTALDLQEFPAMFAPGSSNEQTAGKVGVVDYPIFSNRAVANDFNEVIAKIKSMEQSGIHLNSLMDLFEKFLLKNSISKHKAYHKAAEALGLSRSCFSAKKSKYSLDQSFLS